MSLYKVILADDEAEIREGIRQRINWAELGFDLVAAAENGREALELAEALHPDLLLTDIQMPFMDGLTLGRQLLQTAPGVKLVFFSGFDDFEYAQKAIELGAAQYILKPIDAAELTSVLQRLKSQLDSEYAEKRDIAQLQAHYRNTLPLLRDQFLNRLISGGLTAAQIEAQGERYELDLAGSFWTVARAQSDHRAIDDSPDELVALSVQQLVDENLVRTCRFKSFLYHEQVAIIIMLDEREQASDLITTLGQICLLARRYLDITLTIGVGSLCEALVNLKHSAEGARAALDYRVMIGTGRAIFIDDIEPSGSSELYDDLDGRELVSAIKLGMPDTIRQEVDRLIGHLQAARLPLAQSQLLFMEMVSELFKLTRGYKLDPQEVFGAEFDGNVQLARFDSLRALAEWLGETCLRISGLIRRERTNSAMALAENARKFIAEHYMNPEISVEMLCGHLHVSAAYFSTLFKKETGMSFVAYLTEVRMQEAIRLLSTTEAKTYEISYQVGYTEPNYFSYVFKKQFGISPSKYRNQNPKENSNG